jgi:hypothetical protein
MDDERVNRHVFWKREWLPLVILFVFFRTVYSALGAQVASGPEPERLATSPIFKMVDPLMRQDVLSRTLVDVWFRWDTGWYLKIAAFGFGAKDGSSVYMPLYPLLIRWGSTLTGGDYLLSALLVANIACVGALILFYEVALQEGLSKPEATLATITWCLFPTAFFLYAAYTEAPFLLFGLGGWLAARRRNWLLAGILGGLATLIRLQGVLLAPVFLWMWLAAGQDPQVGPADRIRSVLQAIRRPGWWLRPGGGGRSMGIGALLLPVGVFAAYQWWLSASGFPPTSGQLESIWGIRMVMPWTGFWMFLQRLLFEQRVFIDYVDLAFFLLMLTLAVRGLPRLDPALSLYTWLNLALFLMRGTPPHLLDSFTRYFLCLFPLFFLIGRSPYARLRTAFWAGSFALQLLLTWGFLQWKWVA